MVKIRRASLKDKEQIIGLVKGLYLKDAPEEVEKWKKKYSRLMNGTLVVEIDKKVVAYIALGFEDNSLYIGDLYVLPEYRGRHIAIKLLKKVEKIKKKLKLKYLRVDVREQDKSAVKLYLKFGFKKWKRKPKAKASWKFRKW